MPEKVAEPPAVFWLVLLIIGIVVIGGLLLIGPPA